MADNLHLYELTEAYRELQRMAEDGVEGLGEYLDGAKGSFEEKAIATAKVVRSLEAHAQMFGDEARRLSDRAHALKNASGRLLDYLKSNMEALAIEHIEGDVVDLRIQKSSPFVTVDAEYSIPPQFLRGVLRLPWSDIPPDLQDDAVVEVDKKAILEAWRGNGKAPAGVTIKQGKHLRIR